MRRHVRLYMPRKDGSCVADHIQKTLDQGDEDTEWPEDFPLPEIPPELIHVWEWYWELRQGAPSGVNGYETISHTEMWAWSQLAQVEIQPSTLRYFRIMDTEYLMEANKRTKADKPKPVKQPVVRRR